LQIQAKLASKEQDKNSKICFINTIDVNLINKLL